MSFTEELVLFSVDARDRFEINTIASDCGRHITGYNGQEGLP